MADDPLLLSLSMLGPKVAPAQETVKLKGDASSRSYYRIKLRGFDHATVVAMDLGPLKDGRSDEASRGIGRSGGDIFIDVMRYLERAGVRVPQLLGYSSELGILLLEDLGDTTMDLALQKIAREDWPGFYKRAIDVLVRIQKYAVSADRDCVAFSRSFDRDLYFWELNHFLEFGIVGRGFSPSEEDRSRIKAIFERLSERLASFPRSFTHRDFQSRNFMILGDGDMALIDFQDALMGPEEYDLAALLRDSYVKLDWPEVMELLGYYVHARERTDFPYPKDRSLHETFDLVTVHRKLKDAGRFVFIDRMKKNPSFLPYVGDSLSYVKEALQRLPALVELHALLARYVPELRV